jgi:ribosomal-protein-alanine acetyltransferase
LRWWDIARLVPMERALFPADPWPAEAFWAELAIGSARVYLVADDAGSLLGYGGLSCPVVAAGGDAEIMTLAVAPQTQGQGLGRDLLDALRRTAVERGAGRLVLEVRADNAPARALYAAAGFEPVGTRAGYYRSVPEHDGSTAPVDALVLQLPLAGQPTGQPTGPDSVRP